MFLMLVHVQLTLVETSIKPDRRTVNTPEY